MRPRTQWAAVRVRLTALLTLVLLFVTLIVFSTVRTSTGALKGFAVAGGTISGLLTLVATAAIFRHRADTLPRAESIPRDPNLTPGQAAQRILDLLNCGPEDLTANRAGQLGPTQVGNFRRRGIAYLVVGIPLGLAFAILPALTAVDTTSRIAGLVIFVPIGIITLIGCANLGRAVLRQATAATGVRCVTGPVRVWLRYQGRAGAAVKLAVGETTLTVPVGLRGKFKPLVQSLTGDAYNVYAINNRLLSIEPV